jgi:hypothetical protein
VVACSAGPLSHWTHSSCPERTRSESFEETVLAPSAPKEAQCSAGKRTHPQRAWITGDTQQWQVDTHSCEPPHTFMSFRDWGADVLASKLSMQR